MIAPRGGRPFAVRSAVFLWVGLVICAQVGCGSDDSGGESFCETLNPCETVGCRLCDWPQGTCQVEEEKIFSISLPAAGPTPYSIVMDVVVPSSGTPNACSGPVIVVRSPAGEIARKNLDPDVNNRVCAVSSAPGEHTVSLVCPKYPTKAGYRISVVDAKGNRVLP